MLTSFLEDTYLFLELIPPIKLPPDSLLFTIDIDRLCTNIIRFHRTASRTEKLHDSIPVLICSLRCRSSRRFLRAIKIETF